MCILRIRGRHILYHYPTHSRWLLNAGHTGRQSLTKTLEVIVEKHCSRQAMLESTSGLTAGGSRPRWLDACKRACMARRLHKELMRMLQVLLVVFKYHIQN